MSTFQEAALEPPRHIPQVPHPPGSRRLSAQRLLTPVVFPEAGSRVGAGGAAALLKVKTAAAAPHTECVRLVPPLSETSCSFAHFVGCREKP